MRRMSVIFASACLCALQMACPTVEETPCADLDVTTLLPADNEISSWVGNDNPAAQTATTQPAVEALVNGDANPFTSKGMVAFARKGYSKDNFALELRFWQMPDDETETALFDDIFANNSLYNGMTWSDASLGDAGKVADTGAGWWHVARKCKVQVESKLSPNDAAGQAANEAFIKAVLEKIK